MGRTQTDTTPVGRTNLRSSAVGFVLAVLLTAIPFGLVMRGGYPRPLMVSGILAAAVVQVFVHLYFFLHLDASPSARWKVLALALTVLIMFLFIGGSLWIMYNLNYRMM